MRPHLFPSGLTALVFAAATAFAQVPSFSVVNTGLDATFSNAGKGISDPQVAGITGVAFGSGLFIVIGNSSNEDVIRWATSADGTTWTARSQTIAGGMKTYTQSKVHFLNGKFMFFAVHTLPNVSSTWCYTSADGLTWTAAKVADGNHRIEEFDASPTLTVAAGSDGDQYSSSDLVTWRPSPVVSTGGLYSHNDVAYGAGRFISTINGFGGQTYSSADATTWTALPGLLTPGGGRVEFGNGVHLLSLGALRRSTDGITFTTFTPTLPTGWLNLSGDLRFTGGRFLGQAADVSSQPFRVGYLGSTDGQSWTPVGYLPATPTAPAGTSRLWIYSDIAFGNGKFVQAGVESVQTVSTRATLPLILTVDGSAAPTPAVIATQPKAQTISAGGTAVFSVVATGATSYQWKRGGTAIAGATGATLVVRNATAAQAGNYTVDAIGTGGTTTSAAAALVISASPDFGRIVNLSILTNITATEPSFTVGTVIGGAGTTGSKPLLVRAAGPSLSQLGVSSPLADPRLEVFSGPASIAVNDNWSGDATLASAFARVGAFAYLNAASRDAAAYNAAMPAGGYTVQVTGVGGTTGPVIAELYDATPAASFAAATPRLVNVSVLKIIPTGTSLTAGFVIGGSTAKTVLVRVIGPRLGLAPFNLSGVMSDPKLELFSGQTVIAGNDNWGGDAQLTTVGNAVGAFAVNDAASKDAILLITLAPGSYTAEATPANGTAGGFAIVEVYEVP